MHLPPEDRRRMPRFEMQLPLEVDRGGSNTVMAVTRDVSAGGVYFYLEPDIVNGSTIEFVVTFPPEITLVKSLKVRCTGKIIRMDRSTPQGVGIAAEIQRYEFLTSATNANA
jgi:PilZ domain